MPPTFTSVGVTPGLSAANADDPTAIANAHPIFNALNIALSSDCRRPLPGGAVHRFYGRRQQRKLTTREPELNSPPSIGPSQSTVLFLN